MMNISESELSDAKVALRVGLVEGTGHFSVVRADPEGTRGWRSRYYADKEPAISVLLEVDQPGAIFWSFFGSEDDSVDRTGTVLHIHTTDGQEQIDLEQFDH
jgi:hypothetical protein